MPLFKFELGSADKLVKLFSYPNKPGATESLAETILHWFNQMLARDGFAAEGGTVSVRVEATKYFLDLNGSDDMKVYGERLPKFLEYGAEALDVINNEIKNGKPKTPWPDWVKPPLANTLWDPYGRGNWRFFLPLGMAMVRQKAMNFFHYPPMRLLDEMRDYLDDPVPMRLIEMMKANGIDTEEEAWLYSTVMDGAPIAAPDDEGTIYYPDKTQQSKYPAVHLIPIEYFAAYQEKLTKLLLSADSPAAGFTIPVVVYGTPALDTFNSIWKMAGLSRAKPANRVPIVDGKQTPVLCSGHPYAFYAQVQTVVGAGEMKPETWATAVKTMTNDLAVIRWQIEMSKNPQADPADEWKTCLAYWKDPARLQTVYALVLHQGSLWYPDPKSLEFQFRLSLDDVKIRAEEAADADRKAATRPPPARTRDHVSCFISHSAEDSEFANRLYKDLQEVGVQAWLDSKQIRIGDDWRAEIERALGSVDKVLLVLSRTSIKSHWVRLEIEKALDREAGGATTILFPLRVDEAIMKAADKWSRRLVETKQIADFTNWKREDQYRRAFSRLARDLTVIAATETK